VTWPLAFRTERDQDTGSWGRAAPDTALVERTGRYSYLVMLPGGSVHRVAYAREDGVYQGRCDCKGWEYRDRRFSPCAHLCTLRQAEFIDATTVRGESVVAASVAVEFERAGHTSASAVRADGGTTAYEEIGDLPTRCSGR